MTVRFAQEGAQVYAADIDQARLDETLTYAGDAVTQIKTGIVLCSDLKRAFLSY